MCAYTRQRAEQAGQPVCRRLAGDAVELATAILYWLVLKEKSEG